MVIKYKFIVDCNVMRTNSKIGRAKKRSNKKYQNRKMAKCKILIRAKNDDFSYKSI